MNTRSLEQHFSPGNLARNVIDQQCKKLLIQLLKHIKRGSLSIYDQGQTYWFGEADDTTIQARIDVQNSSAWRQVLLGGSVGSGAHRWVGGESQR